MSREKRRQELFVTVPNHFRCPISMDVMKSPVSLSTGVTYDRSSIEKWLSLGNNTCPATMQTLPSTLTTPNLTLRRLINLWLSHPDINLASSPPISKQQAVDIISGEFDSDSLVQLIRFMTASEENLKFVALSGNPISRFIEEFAKSDEIRILELIVEILDLISPVVGVKERLSNLILKTVDGKHCLQSFAMVLQKGNTESKAKSAKIMEQIAVNPESQQKITEITQILHVLYSLCTVETDLSALEAGLSALLTFSTTRLLKKELIRLGIVGTIGKILSATNSSTPVRAVVEKSLATLERVATCTEGRGAIEGDGECVAAVVRWLMKCSGAATEHGVAVLWSVCCLAGDSAAQEKVAAINGLTKVLLVMQSGCTAGTRQMCVELIKMLRPKGATSNLAPYESRTTHITPY